jgi:hypothetical protein
MGRSGEVLLGRSGVAEDCFEVDQKGLAGGGNGDQSLDESVVASQGDRVVGGVVGGVGSDQNGDDRVVLKFGVGLEGRQEGAAVVGVEGGVAEQGLSQGGVGGDDGLAARP